MTTNLGPSTNQDGIGQNGETISVTQFSQAIEDDENARVDFRTEIGEVDQNKDADVDLIIYAIVDHDPIELDTSPPNELVDVQPQGSISHQDLEENDIITGTIDISFDEVSEPTEKNFWLLAGYDYHNISGYNQDNGFPEYNAWSDSWQITVRPATQEARSVQITDEDISVGSGPTLTDDAGPSTASHAQQAFPDYDFRIIDIQFEGDATVSDIPGWQPQTTVDGEDLYEIVFDYAGNPNISIDTGGRFVKHEIIGGPVVRQKVGEEPDSYSISGVCYQGTANQIDALKDARFGKIASSRIPGNIAQPVQFASASTEPIAEGGAVDMAAPSRLNTENPESQLLYTYKINAIEINRNIESSGSTNDTDISNISGGL